MALNAAANTNRIRAAQEQLLNTTRLEEPNLTWAENWILQSRQSQQANHLNLTRATYQELASTGQLTWMQRLTFSIGILRAVQQQTIHQQARQLQEQEQAPVQNNERLIDAHEHALNISASNSLKRLDARYPELDVPATLKAIQTYIQALPPGPQKQAADSCFSRVQIIIDTHVATGFTVAKILALTWHAANDSAVGDAKAGFPAPIKPEYIKLRQEAIVERMVQAQTDRNGDAVCFTGKIVRIVEGLSNAHEDVTIVYDIKELAWIKILHSSNEELSKLPKGRQQEIIKTWGEEGETAAAEFIKNLKLETIGMLNQEFKDLIMPKDIDDLLKDKFQYLPPPMNHPELVKLTNIFDENAAAGTTVREKVFCDFSKKYRQALLDKEYDYAAVYQIMNEKYTEFLRLDKFLQKLTSLNDSNINSAIEVAYYKYLHGQPVADTLQMVRTCAVGVIQSLQPENQFLSSVFVISQRVQQIETALTEDSPQFTQNRLMWWQ